MEETWQITPKGLQVAQDILKRFTNSTTPLEEIAADYGLSVDEARVLMFIAEQGMVTTNFEEEDIT